MTTSTNTCEQKSVHIHVRRCFSEPRTSEWERLVASARLDMFNALYASKSIIGKCNILSESTTQDERRVVIQRYQKWFQTTAYPALQKSGDVRPWAMLCRIQSYDTMVASAPYAQRAIHEFSAIAGMLTSNKNTSDVESRRIIRDALSWAVGPRQMALGLMRNDEVWQKNAVEMMIRYGRTHVQARAGLLNWLALARPKHVQEARHYDMSGWYLPRQNSIQVTKLDRQDETVETVVLSMSQADRLQRIKKAL